MKLLEDEDYGRGSHPRPFLYAGELPDGIRPLDRVVSLGKKDQAWGLPLLRRKRELRVADGIVIRWTPGQNSALDSSSIADGKDVGNIVVQRKTSAGLVDVPYFVDFAFAFHAFFPSAPIHN